MARHRSYWAVARPTSGSNPTAHPDVIVAQDGFHVLAAIAPMLWALYHRQWRWALFLGLIASVCSGITYVVPEQSWIALLAQTLTVTLNIWYGFEAQNLRYAEYIRLGYTDLGPIQAHNLDAADITGLAIWREHTYSQTH